MKIAPPLLEQGVTVRLNKDFYTENAVRAASEDFSEHFSIRIVSGQKDFIVTLTPKNESVESASELVGGEFANYVLSLMQTG